MYIIFLLTPTPLLNDIYVNRISQEQERKALRWNEGSYRGDEVPLTNENLVQNWRYVLRSASGLAGFVVLNSRLVTSSLSSF